jgi:hypothetical protein
MSCKRSGWLAVQLFWSLFLLLALSSTPILAQSTASISGLVTDPSGAVVPNVQMTLKNRQTGTTLRVATNRAGLYALPFVQPGNYELTADAVGFKRFEQNGIVVATAARLAIDVHLQIGSKNETVNVRGGAPEINTSGGSVSTVINRQFVANMPLNGRSFQDLISLTPGVITDSPNESGEVGLTGDFSINGQRTESNGYVVDGVSVNFSAGNGGLVGDGGGNVPAVSALGTTQALVPVDDLQEFRVLSSSYSAEYGRAAGGQVVLTTRSGTNDWHGDLYDYLRNDSFDANNWFNDYLNVRKPQLRQNDFGGTFGGPVRIPKLYNGKDKTFFFVSYEGLRLTQPQTATLESVPDLNLRANSASAITPILNAFPLPNGPEEMVPCSGTTFSNATPYPCTGGVATGTPVASGLAEYDQAYSLPSDINATSIRLDQNVSSKMRVFVRFSDAPSEVESRQRAFSNLTGFHSNTLTNTIGVTNQLSSNITNNFRLGYGRNSMYTNGYIDSFGGATPINYDAVAGISGYPDPEPDMVLIEPGTITSAFFITSETDHSRQWNLVDTLSVAKGHHQLTFGFDYRRLTSSVEGYNPLVFAEFTNPWQLENNLADNFEIIAYQAGEPLFNAYALFAQDEWRVASRLSLSLGLRWDVEGPPTSANGQPAYTGTGSIDDPSSLGVAPRGTPLWDTPYLNFAPRLGVAYELRTNPGWETVLRSGGGVFFDNDNFLAAGAYQGLGFYGYYTCPAVTCGYPATQAEITAALPPTGVPYTSTSLYYFPTHLQSPYSLQWNGSVQQGLGADQSLTLSYVGALARRLPNFQYYSLNAQNSNFGSVISAYGGIHSNYNALQASFQRTLHHGVQVLASYEWAHTLDNTSEGIVNIGERLFPPQYGNSDLDLRQNFVAGMSWNLPGTNHGSVSRAVLSHWGLDARFTARTGFPVQVFGSSGTLTDPATGLQYYSGVSLNTGVPLYLYGAACTAYYVAHGNPNNGKGCPGGRAVNPAAFSSTNSLDNPAPKNYARAFGENQINLALRREFPIRGNLRLQVRAEAYNVLNHPIFGGIDGTVGSSTFGQATSTLSTSLGTVSSLYQQGGPRSMQFALKLIF